MGSQPWKQRKWGRLSLVAQTLVAGAVWVGPLGNSLLGQSWMRDALKEPTSVTGNAGTTANGNLDGSNIKGTFSLRGGFEYSDNVKLEKEGRAGLAVVLGGNAGFTMPLTVNNELYLQVSMTRHVFISGEKGRQNFQSISPGSNLGLDVFVGRAKIRTFLDFSLQEDPIDSVVVNETDRFGRFNLDAGVQLDWDMNKIVIQALTLAGRQWHTDGDGSLDAWRYASNLRTFFPTGAAGGWGISAGVSQVDYQQAIQNNSDSVSVGLFAQQMLSRNMKVVAEIGWQNSEFGTLGSLNDFENYSGIYGSLIFDHQIRRSVRYSLSLRHDANDGIGSNFYELTSISFTPQISLSNQTNLNLLLGYDWIDESGVLGETATRLRASARVQRPLSSKITGSLEWSYVNKDSDLISRTYARNLFTVMMEYSP
jgi:hypothetical protein